MLKPLIRYLSLYNEDYGNACIMMTNYILLLRSIRKFPKNVDRELRRFNDITTVIITNITESLTCPNLLYALRHVPSLKLYIMCFNFLDMAEMLSKMKTLLIDVLLEKCLPDGSRIKLKDCISMVESFSIFLNNVKKQEQNSENSLKPLHSGLSRSMECLNEKKSKIPKSRSASDIANFDLVSKFYESYSRERLQAM